MQRYSTIIYSNAVYAISFLFCDQQTKIRERLLSMLKTSATPREKERGKHSLVSDLHVQRFQQYFYPVKCNHSGKLNM